MKFRLIFLIGWVCCMGAPMQNYAQPVQAGAAVRVITPEPLLPVSGGIGTPQPATIKKGDLFVRALVLGQGNVKIALVSVDNLGWPGPLADKSRALVRDIPPENILISATHTHSGPDAYGFPDGSGKSNADLKYLDWCVRQIAEAINEAAGKLEPAALKIAVGEAKGKIAYNYYAEQLYDPRCGVIQAVSLKNPGRVIATLVNYAVHPEIIGSKRGILSPDLCGPLYDRIESKAGGVALFMNGAQGGMVTADNRQGSGEANDWDECVRIGQLLADEALRIAEPAKPIADLPLSNTWADLTLPVEADIMKHILKNSPVNLMKGNSDSVRTRVNLITLGPARLLTIPGEALPNIGYYLKRKLAAPFPFLLGLTNDAFGYILTKEDFNSFRRYEYITATSLGENTYELYLQKVNELLKAAPPSSFPK